MRELSKFTLVDADDWIIIYKNGIMVDEGHSFSIEKLAEIFEVNLDVINLTTEEQEKFIYDNDFPENLEQLNIILNKD